MGKISTLEKRRARLIKGAPSMPPAPRRDREYLRDRDNLPEFGTYLFHVPHAESKPSLDLRRRRFADLVRRQLEAARERGMTVEQIEEATGVGKSTFYRWQNGNWSRDPRGSEVRSFFLKLGGMGKADEAYRALGWSENSTPKEPEPITEDPDVRAVMRALSDPKVHPAVKLMIRRQLRALAQEAERPEE